VDGRGRGARGGRARVEGVDVTSALREHEGPGNLLRSRALRWLRGLDLNQRPLGYEFRRTAESD